MFPYGRHDCVIRFLQFAPDRIIRRFSQVRMRPRVIGNLMTFTNGATENIWMICGILADHKKGGMHVMGRE
jgi:hypothetical protein